MEEQLKRAVGICMNEGVPVVLVPVGETQSSNSKAYQERLDTVCRAIGISYDAAEADMTAMLSRVAAALGFTEAVIGTPLIESTVAEIDNSLAALEQQALEASFGALLIDKCPLEDPDVQSVADWFTDRVLSEDAVPKAVRELRLHIETLKTELHEKEVEVKQVQRLLSIRADTLTDVQHELASVKTQLETANKALKKKG